MVLPRNAPPTTDTITHSSLRVPREIVVWIYDAFDDIFEIEDDFTKYLKESCWYYSDEHFSFKYFPKQAFARKISSKLSGRFWMRKALMG